MKLWGIPHPAALGRAIGVRIFQTRGIFIRLIMPITHLGWINGELDAMSTHSTITGKHRDRLQRPITSYSLYGIEREFYGAQSINQSINQSIKRSRDQEIKRSINQEINQEINQSRDQSIKRSINQEINQEIKRSIIQAINLLISQVINQWYCSDVRISFLRHHILGRKSWMGHGDWKWTGNLPIQAAPNRFLFFL